MIRHAVGKKQDRRCANEQQRVNIHENGAYQALQRVFWQRAQNAKHHRREQQRDKKDAAVEHHSVEKRHFFGTHAKQRKKKPLKAGEAKNFREELLKFCRHAFPSFKIARSDFAINHPSLYCNRIMVAVFHTQTFRQQGIPFMPQRNRSRN